MSTRQSRTFYLRPNTHRTVGRFAFDVSVSASADDGQEFGPLPIRVTGQMESDVAWSPQDVLLLWTTPSVAPREDVLFWSRSGQPFQVVDVIGAPDFLHVDVRAPRLDANATTQTVSLSGAQAATNRSFGTVLLRVRTGDNSDLEIPIPVSVQSVANEPTLHEDE